jgi:transcription elongation factor GreA
MNLDKIPHDRVGFGSTVHLKMQRPDDCLSISDAEDADVEHGLISTASPIGRGLLGRKKETR